MILISHVIDNKLVDDTDMNKELKSLFMRTNMLYRRFNRCNVQVKVRLLQSFCVCFYDAGSGHELGKFQRGMTKPSPPSPSSPPPLFPLLYCITCFMALLRILIVAVPYEITD